MKKIAEIAGSVWTCCAPLTAKTIQDDEAEATASIFHALGDPNRVKIINFLSNAKEPACVCDITALLGLSQPTTSFHLKKLMSVGLLDREQRGTWAYFSLNRSAVRKLSSIVNMERILG